MSYRSYLIDRFTEARDALVAEGYDHIALKPPYMPYLIFMAQGYNSDRRILIPTVSVRYVWLKGLASSRTDNDKWAEFEADVERLIAKVWPPALAQGKQRGFLRSVQTGLDRLEQVVTSDEEYYVADFMFEDSQGIEGVVRSA